MTKYIESKSVGMLRVYLQTNDAVETGKAFGVSFQSVLSNYSKHLKDKREIMNLAELEVMDWPNTYRDRNDKYQKTSSCIATELAWLDKTMLEIQDEQSLCKSMDKNFDMRGFEFCVDRMKRRKKNLLNRLYAINNNQS
jgi:hypothetical protein